MKMQTAVITLASKGRQKANAAWLRRYQSSGILRSGIPGQLKPSQPWLQNLAFLAFDLHVGDFPKAILWLD